MPHFETVFAPDKALRDKISSRLSEYNRRQTGEEEWTQLAIVARDDAGQIIAGLLGHLSWDWLKVDILWVDETYREQGIGARLLQDAEAVALDRGFTQAHLNTFSFQAPQFYMRQGYHIFATLEGKPKGHSLYFLRKSLEPRA